MRGWLSITEIRGSFCQRVVLDHILTLHRKRIHARLRCQKWVRPAYLRRQGTVEEPLRQSLERLCGSKVFCRTREARELAARLRKLIDMYKSHDEIIDEKPELEHLEKLVSESYRICSHNDSLCMRDTLKEAGLKSNLVFQNRHVRQLDKIGAYFRIAKTFAAAARKYRS